ncbi:hypothetical protein N0V82_010641 [Gnomoniopsis sp. IMI 355080]|nr:hypothetical protein N0V82_010641 [Gnomoniopsis sp. IMI 355080]
MATTSLPTPTTPSNTDPIAHVDPPVPLEEELHLIFHFASKGLLPITKHQDTQGQAQNPLDTIQRMTQQIKRYLPMIEKDVRQCGYLILFESEQHMEAFIRKSTEHLESLYRYRHARMYCLTKHVCGDKAETRLAKQLHEKVEARWEGLFDPELRKLINDRFLHKKNTWIKNREAITTWLGVLGHFQDVIAPLEFMRQLNDDPPQATHRSDRDDLASFNMDAQHLKASSIQSPWVLLGRQSSNAVEATRSQASDQQPNSPDSEVESTPTGSSSETQEVSLPRR